MAFPYYGNDSSDWYDSAPQRAHGYNRGMSAAYGERDQYADAYYGESNEGSYGYGGYGESDRFGMSQYEDGLVASRPYIDEYRDPYGDSAMDSHGFYGRPEMGLYDPHVPITRRSPFGGNPTLGRGRGGLFKDRGRGMASNRARGMGADHGRGMTSNRGRGISSRGGLLAKPFPNQSSRGFRGGGQRGGQRGGHSQRGRPAGNTFIDKKLENLKENALKEEKTPISLLMEYGQLNQKVVTFVELSSSKTKPHSYVKIFKFAAVVGGNQFPAETGPNKKLAKQNAAQCALRLLGVDTSPPKAEEILKEKSIKDKRQQRKRQKKEIPPSKVVYIRSLPDDAEEIDIETLAKPFGKISKMIVLTERQQAFVQFEDETSAVEMVTKFSVNNPADVKHTPCPVQFALFQELTEKYIQNPWEATLEKKDPQDNDDNNEDEATSGLIKDEAAAAPAADGSGLELYDGNLLWERRAKLKRDIVRMLYTFSDKKMERKKFWHDFEKTYQIKIAAGPRKRNAFMAFCKDLFKKLDKSHMILRDDIPEPPPESEIEDEPEEDVENEEEKRIKSQLMNFEPAKFYPQGSQEYNQLEIDLLRILSTCPNKKMVKTTKNTMRHVELFRGKKTPPGVLAWKLFKFKSTTSDQKKQEINPNVVFLKMIKKKIVEMDTYHPEDDLLKLRLCSVISHHGGSCSLMALVKSYYQFFMRYPYMPGTLHQVIKEHFAEEISVDDGDEEVGDITVKLGENAPSKKDLVIENLVAARSPTAKLSYYKKETDSSDQTQGTKVNEELLEHDAIRALMVLNNREIVKKDFFYYFMRINGNTSREKFSCSKYGLDDVAVLINVDKFYQHLSKVIDTKLEEGETKVFLKETDFVKSIMEDIFKSNLIEVLVYCGGSSEKLKDLLLLYRDFFGALPFPETRCRELVTENCKDVMAVDEEEAVSLTYKSGFFINDDSVCNEEPAEWEDPAYHAAADEGTSGEEGSRGSAQKRPLSDVKVEDEVPHSPQKRRATRRAIKKE